LRRKTSTSPSTATSTPRTCSSSRHASQPHLRCQGSSNLLSGQSLTSRGYLKTRFSWQYYYYTLTPEGLDYLREWLHLPAEIVPQTHIKQQRSHAPPRGMLGGDDRERRPGGGRGGRGGERDGGRDTYRRRDAGEKTESGGAPGEFKPEFRGGFGRGRGRGGDAPPA
jgi:small subunit ribosomal protein S10e